MVSSDNVRGMEIINFKNKKVGVAINALWLCKNEEIDGFILIKNDFLQLRRFLPFSSVKEIKNGRIYLIKNYKTKFEKEYVLHGKAVIGGRRVFISKYFFDEKNGRVKSVEIAKSIYEDVRQKRKTYDDFSVENGLVKINREEKT